MAYFKHHPDYNSQETDWSKFRDILDGGRCFIDNYLYQLTKSESQQDYLLRKQLSYNPAFSKSALVDIRNAIVQRLPDVHRSGGPASYQSAIIGQDGGVSGKGDTMNSFLAKEVILEMLGMSKIGVFIDRNPLPEDASIIEANEKRPYLYTYRAEDIINWRYSFGHTLERLLVKHKTYTFDEFGLVDGYTDVYRLFIKESDSVTVVDYDNEETEHSRVSLHIPEIPFVIFEIDYSLLADIAEYQIALLNLCSSDLLYAVKGNFAFYVEQYDPSNPEEYMKPAPQIPNTPNDSIVLAGTEFSGREPGTGKTEEIQVGGLKGRRVSKGVEFPKFINPSIEPLKASISLRQTLKDEIRALVQLAVSGLSPKVASAEAKFFDAQSVEAGLATIGVALQSGERQIANIWSLYEGSSSKALINYPSTYSVTTTEQRISTAQELQALSDKVPSVEGKKAIARKVTDVLFSATLPEDTLTTIYREISEAPNVVSDSASLKSDVELGLVDNETASEIRGYPKGSVEKAKKDHAERLARVQAAQTPRGAPVPNAGARGIADLNVDPNAAKNEKTQSQAADKNPDSGTKQVRGKGRKP